MTYKEFAEYQKLHEKLPSMDERMDAIEKILYEAEEKNGKTEDINKDIDKEVK